MQLKPLMDRVVVKQVETEEVSKGGIILTSAAKEKPQFAEVIAVGPGKTEDGKLVKIDLKKGQRVIYKKYSGTEVTVDKQEYLLISAEDILAVVE